MTDHYHYADQARYLLMTGQTNCRAFDDCFENFCGDEVVRLLMEWATCDTKLQEAIQRAGFWDHWQTMLIPTPTPTTNI